MKKNILILNYEYPPLGGGAGVVSQKYAQGLSELGYNVTVLTTWFKGEKEIEIKNNLKIIKIKSRRKKAFASNPIEMLDWARFSIKFLKTYLKDNKIDMCIAFFGVPGGIVARYINKKFQIPYMISTHGADVPGFFPHEMKYYHMLTSWYIRKVYQKAEKVLLLTGFMKDLAVKFAPEFKSKYVILPNGCDADFFDVDLSQRSDKLTLLWVGRLVDIKDPMTMLQAVKIFNSRHKNWKLNIVGDGILKPAMQDFVQQNNLSDKVNFVGRVDNQTIKKYYQSSHVQICTSRGEAMSVAILESLYCGTYILSTPVSGNTDVIKPDVNGEFFGIGDYVGLADILVDISNKYKDIKINEDYLDSLKKEYSRTNIIYKLSKIIG